MMPTQTQISAENQTGTLVQKRSMLLAQIAAERSALAYQGAALRPAAQVIDKVSSGVRYVSAHPEILLVPVAVLALWRPRRILSLAVSGLGFWRMLQGWRTRIR